MAYRVMHPQFEATFEHYKVPKEMQDAFWNYFAYGIDPGSFGMAVLRDSYSEAVVRAHQALTSEHLRSIAKWLYNVPPKQAFGSDEKIKQWKTFTDEARRDIMIELRLRPSEFDILRGLAVA
jgi:hypothetical protein